MGFIRFMRQGARLQREFVELLLSPAAYCPALLPGETIEPVPLPPGAKRPAEFPVTTERDAILLLHGLADVGQIWRMTAGDTAILASELMHRIDQARDLETAIIEVVHNSRIGGLIGMDGLPLANGAQIPAIHLELVGRAVRPAAFIEMRRN